MRIQIDLETFDGAKFAEKYNLDSEAGDFWVEGDELVVPSLQECDPSDCVVDLISPQIAQEWEKANEIALSVLDHNSRGQCQYLMVADPLNIPLQEAIQTLWDAMESVWTQYAANKALIEAGQTANDYVIPEGLPTIWDIMSLKSA